MSTKRELEAAKKRVIDEARTVVATLSGRWVWDTAPDIRALDRAICDLDGLMLNFDGDRPTAARDTSIAAAKTRLPAAGSLRRQVLATVYWQWDRIGLGLTTEQVEHRLKRAHASVSSAVNYLENHGLLHDSGRRAATAAGCKAIVYEPTDLAVQHLTADAARQAVQ